MKEEQAIPIKWFSPPSEYYITFALKYAFVLIIYVPMTIAIEPDAEARLVIRIYEFFAFGFLPLFFAYTTHAFKINERGITIYKPFMLFRRRLPWSKIGKVYVKEKEDEHEGQSFYTYSLKIHCYNGSFTYRYNLSSHQSERFFQLIRRKKPYSSDSKYRHPNSY
ncbi:hypothetical protein BKI52_40400 [marine bacterium AO1-C]|nr:hypothetical protein BKI52_40400 [marine bacterium AO1-C]